MAISAADFVAIAAVLKATNASPATVQAMCDTLEQRNPRFDRERFTDAATPTDPPHTDPDDWNAEALIEINRFLMGDK
jgi:hypothetical protein